MFILVMGLHSTLLVQNCIPNIIVSLLEISPCTSLQITCGFFLKDETFVGGILVLSVNDFKVIGMQIFIKIRLKCYISVVYEISTFVWFWQKLNGLSNKYWGWGLEDDEFYQRMKQGGIKLLRPENVTETANCFR